MKEIKIAFWYKNYQSPVIFMVDDLANIYFNSAGEFNYGDWGGEKETSRSLYNYLKKKIIHYYPELKFTFFLVTGEREIQSTGKYDYSKRCDQDGFGNFLNNLSNEGHEVAYHGKTHGRLDTDNNFIQEWTSFQSFDESDRTTKEGIEIYTEATSNHFSGGKYCGYEVGDYGHDSIVNNNFDWWFDRWDSDITLRPYGEFKDGVLYLPSNVDCSIYSWKLFSYFKKKKYYSSIVRQLQSRKVESTLKALIELKGIISLQEHTSPIRTDGKTQYPNVFDDYTSIMYILKFLSQHDIWWATSTEVSNYTRNRTYVNIKGKSKFEFKFESDEVNQCKESEILSLIVEKGISHIVVNNVKYLKYIKNNETLIDVPVYFGLYYKVIYESL